jgi:hypothetical protein
MPSAVPDTEYKKECRISSVPLVTLSFFHPAFHSANEKSPCGSLPQGDCLLSVV